MSDHATTFNIGGPGPGGGGLDKAAHLKHLLSFVNPVAEKRDGVSGEYDVALCSFVLCHTCREAWADLPVSGTALAPRITNSENEIVAGVLVLGEAKAGRTAPYLLEETTAEQLAAVGDDYGKFGAKMPSGKIVVDIDGFTAIGDEPL